MTTFDLVVNLSLIFLGLLILATMVAIAVQALSIFRIAMQIIEQVRPLIARGKELATTAKAIGGAARHGSREIKEEVNNVKEEVAHRASGTAWLLRRTILSPIISVIATAAGVGSGVQSWRTRRSRHVPIVKYIERESAVEERNRAA